MPKSYWLVVKSPENFDIARDRGFDMVGLKVQHRRKVQRMEPEDRVLIYISQKRRFGATATVTSSMKEDHTPIWKDEIGNDFPFRVSIKPDIVLDESQQIDAYQIAPRMDYTRRWIPEMWHMAFLDSLHLISKFDFALLEEEMRKAKRNRRPTSIVASSPSNGTTCALERLPTKESIPH